MYNLLYIDLFRENSDSGDSRPGSSQRPGSDEGLPDIPDATTRQTVLQTTALVENSAQDDMNPSLIGHTGTLVELSGRSIRCQVGLYKYSGCQYKTHSCTDYSCGREFCTRWDESVSYWTHRDTTRAVR